MITIIYNISSLYLCLVVGPCGQLESKFKCEATNKWFNEIQIYICIYKEIGVSFLSLLFICRHTFCLTSSLSDPLLLQIGTASERSLGLIYNLYTYDLHGVQEKLCFFTIHCNPSLAYIAVRDLQSSQHTQCECTVTPIGW